MKIAVIGAGNMGGAIAAGAIRAGVAAAQDVIISDPSPMLADTMKAEGVKVGYTADNRSAVPGADLVIVAVKPWLMEQVLGEIREVLDRGRQAVVSIAAGITFSQLEGWLAAERFGGLGIYRVIPNTAISLGRSTTFIASLNTTAEQDSLVMDLFKALGEVYEVGEDKIGAATALSSSGIAYAYKYMEAAVYGGVAMGIRQDEALRIVLSTVKGAVAMLEANGSQPREEIAKVTTPGGITLKGLEAMEQGGFTQAVVNGLLATK